METYLSDSKEDEVQIKMNRTKVKSAVSQYPWRCGHGPQSLEVKVTSIQKVLYVLDSSENTGSKSLKLIQPQLKH